MDCLKICQVNAVISFGPKTLVLMRSTERLDKQVPVEGPKSRRGDLSVSQVSYLIAGLL